MDKDFIEKYELHANYQRLNKEDRDKGSCYIPLDENNFTDNKVSTFLQDSIELLNYRFRERINH